MLSLGGLKGKAFGSLPSAYATWAAYAVDRGHWADIIKDCLEFSKEGSWGEEIEQQTEIPVNGKLQGRDRSAIACLAHNLTSTLGQGSWKKALPQLKQQGIVLDVSTYASVLRWSGNVNALSDGKWAHGRIVESGLEYSVYLLNLILQMYGNCGALEDARVFFTTMHQRDRFTWNFMITAYARHGKGSEALQVFYQMLMEGEMPDKFTYPSVLSACVDQAALADGKKIHSCIKNCGFEADPVVANALLSMYGNCGNLEDAWGLFDKLIERDAVSWNAMISICAQHERRNDALELFEQMQQAGIRPSNITFITIVSAFGNRTPTLTEGKNVHKQITDNGFEAGLAVENALVSLYGKCGSVEDALQMFDKMVERDRASWNAIITAHAHHGQSKDTFQLFLQMQQEGFIPNGVTFCSILSVCASDAALFEGQQLHACIRCSGLELDVFVLSALVTMYCKCEGLEEARRLFDMMRKRDVFCWNNMIAAHAQSGHHVEAVKLFHQMQWEGLIPDKFILASVLSSCTNKAAYAEGKRLHMYVIGSGIESDIAVGTALVNMYGKGSSLEDARRMFETMPERNMLSWSSMIAVYAQHGQDKDALELFSQMWGEGILPNKVTLVNIISCCACQVALSEGRRLHACIRNTNFDTDVVVGTALVNMYGKCGCLKDSERVFREMPERNTLSWNAMIAAYAQHGQVKIAFKIFDHMWQDAVMPDRATFISLLSACSHAGLVDEGHYYFFTMHQHCGIVADVDHFNCMIDLFGRAGRLEEAENFINFTPFQPTVASWLTLLSACRHLLDVERGKDAAIHLFELAPKKSGSYVMLSNLYAREHNCKIDEEDDVEGFQEVLSYG